MGLRKKFFLLFLLVVIFPSIVMALLSFWLTTNILSSRYEELITDNTEYTAGILEREIFQLNGIADFLYRNDLVIERIGPESVDDNVLEQVQKDYKLSNAFSSFLTYNSATSFKTVYLAGYDDQEFWYTAGNDFIQSSMIHERVSQLTDLGQNDFYRGMAPSLDMTLGERAMMIFYRPLIDKSFKDIGYLYMELDVSYFRDILYSSRRFSETSFILVDGEGSVIYSETDDEIGISYSPSDEDLLSVEAVLNNEWRLISTTPKSYVDDQYGVFIIIIVLTTIVTIVLSSLLLWFITKRVVKPIHQLADTMDKAASSDELNEVYYKSNDEIGRLTDSFNKMSVRVKEAHEAEIDNDRKIKTLNYQALQAQINPHFLYNTLNTISWMAHIQKADTIKDMIDQLWNILKSVSNGGEYGTIGDELLLIQAFCKIQQVKYNGKFALELEVDEKLYNMKCPKFMLQPFVENAIFHGIEPKRGTGIIRIVSTIEKDKIALHVMDDGIGMSQQHVGTLLEEEVQNHSEKSFNHVGIINIHKRLELLYGEGYGIEVVSTEAVGTDITIIIPLDNPMKAGEKVV